MMNADETVAYERLAACKDFISIVEANPDGSRLGGLTFAQLNRLEALTEVDLYLFNSLEIKNKAGFTTQQVNLLYAQKGSIESQQRTKLQRDDKE